MGLVSSLSRPGGNLTGLSLFAAELTAKRLELIKEAVPSVTRVAILLNPGNASTPFVLSETEATAKASRVELKAFEARQPADFARVFAAMADQRVDALVIHEDTVLNANANSLAVFAAVRRLPSSGFPEIVEAHQFRSAQRRGILDGRDDCGVGRQRDLFRVAAADF